MPIIIFILGLVIGSFLNVLIYRIPKGDDFIYDKSRCPNCQTDLKAADLIPVFSYLFLDGRCRYCGEGIKLIYPMVELLTGVVFMLTFFHIGIDVYLLKYLFFFSCLIVISLIDLDQQIIPNKLVTTILLWGAAWQIGHPEIPWDWAFLGALLGSGLLFLAAVISRGGMGGGDIKLMLAAGFILGLSHTALALFIGFFLGSIVGLLLILIGLKKRKDPIPFGPFLSIGIFVAALWGYQIIDLYMQIMF